MTLKPRTIICPATNAGWTVSSIEPPARFTQIAKITAAITKRYPTATLTTCERATENRRVSFEIGLKGAAVKTVELAADGTWISPKVAK